MSDAHMSGIFAGLYGQPREVPTYYAEAAGASWLAGWDFGAGKPVEAAQISPAVSPPDSGRRGVGGLENGRTGHVGGGA